jgi:recombination protein RecA
MSIANALAAALTKGKVTSDVIADSGLHLSTGIPNVDFALSGKYRGGGLKSSRIVEIASPASAGKTLLSQHVIKEAQIAGGAGAFHDHERTFIPSLFERFGGSIEPGIWTYRRPRCLEESFDQAIDWMGTIRKADVIPFEAPLVCVFDSAAAMVPAAKLEPRKPGEALNMRDKLALATAFSQELPAFNQFVVENNILAIFLNQMRLKPGVLHGDPRYTPGGEAMFYYDAVKIYLARSMNKDNKKDTKEVTGQTIRLEAIKNKTYRPFMKTEFEFKFNEDGTGYIDVIDSMLTHLRAKGKLETSGAYIVWEGKKLYQSQLSPILNAQPDALGRLLDIAENGAQVAPELSDNEDDVAAALAALAPEAE